MNVPDKILAQIDEMQAPYAVIAQVESAVIEYMRFGCLPVGINSMAQGLFEQLRPQIDVILVRRRKAAEYRRRRKEAMQLGAPEKADSRRKKIERKADAEPKRSEGLKADQTPQTDRPAFGMEGLTRQQIRSIERTQRQIAQREHRLPTPSRKKKQKVKTVRHYAGI